MTTQQPGFSMSQYASSTDLFAAMIARITELESQLAQRFAAADSVLYDPKAVLDVFHSARAGSEKPVGYLRGIRAVIAHWESRPEPHRWMVPARADSVQEDALRYRWLREGNDAKHGAAWHVAVNLYGCEWDAAIDAARKQGASQ